MAALVQLLQPRHFFLAGGDHQLAALLEGHAVARAQKRFIDAAPATQLRAFSEPVL